MGALRPAAMTAPSLTSTAPTGTSPAFHASCACSRASAMKRSSSASGGGVSVIGDLGPAIRGFVQHQLVQVQAGAEAVQKRRAQDVEGDPGQVFHGGNAVDHHRLVPGQGGQEGAHGLVLVVDDEGVVPDVDQVLLGQGLDVGKAFEVDHGARQGNFQGVAVAVQVAALALVVGNTVAGIEFELAGNGQHGRGTLGYL